VRSDANANILDKVYGRQAAEPGTVLPSADSTEARRKLERFELAPPDRLDRLRRWDTGLGHLGGQGVEDDEDALDASSGAP
jgi:hypothetical protein